MDGVIITLNIHVLNQEFITFKSTVQFVLRRNILNKCPERPTSRLKENRMRSSRNSSLIQLDANGKLSAADGMINVLAVR